MDPEKKIQSRPNISSRSIKLTHSDPVKRLKEFCKKGKYYHQIKWDKYANGFMLECEVSYNLGRHGHKRRVLAKEARWVETDNLIEGQRVIAAILLDNLGLGILDDCEENEDVPLQGVSPQDFTEVSIKAVTGVLNQVSQQLDNEEGNKDPLLSMAGGLIKQMTTMMSDTQEESENTQEESENTQEESENTQDTKSIDNWGDICAQAAKSVGNWGDICQDASPPDNQEIKSWADIASIPK